MSIDNLHTDAVIVALKRELAGCKDDESRRKEIVKQLELRGDKPAKQAVKGK